jgi:lysophospholipase
MILRLLFVFLTLLPTATWAGDISLQGAEAFLKEMKSETIALPGRAPLFNHYYRSEKILPTAIVFLPGMGESALKYYDLAQDLKPVHATLYMWDHIGQGLSSHLIPDEPTKVYIDDFETYIGALENFFSVLHQKHSAIYVIGHSMGGHVALRLAIRHPQLIQKLALSSPLVDLNFDEIPIQKVIWLFKYLPGKWFPPLYFLFKQGKKKNVVTKSKERVEVQRQLFGKYPAIHREAATIGWLREALRSIALLRTEQVEKLTMPILILQADRDFLVSTKAQSELCEKLPHCTTQVIPDAYHELLFEKDPARQTAVDAILHFLKNSRL